MAQDTWERRFKMLAEFNVWLGGTVALALVWHYWLGALINETDERGRNWTFSILIALIPGAFISAPLASMGSDMIVHRLRRHDVRATRLASTEAEE